MSISEIQKKVILGQTKGESLRQEVSPDESQTSYVLISLNLSKQLSDRLGITTEERSWWNDRRFTIDRWCDGVHHTEYSKSIADDDKVRDAVCDVVLCDGIICDGVLCDSICDSVLCDSNCDSVCDAICDHICDGICDKIGGR